MIRYVVVTALLTAAVVGGARVVFASLLRPQYSRDQVLAGMHLLHTPAAALVHRTPPALAANDERPILQRIRERGALRVGYMPDALPFAFFNVKGDLVGLDVELAHRLASELRVSLEFLPIDRARLAEQLDAGYCDIVMAGVAVTTLRAGRLLFSSSYLDETVGFAVPDHAREAFSHWSALATMSRVTIAVPDVPYYIDMIRQRIPGAEVRVVEDIGPMFEQWDPSVDALALPAERASAWTLLYPKFSVVVPQPGVMKVPLAFPIAGHDQAFVSFINTWIDLKRKDGTIDALYAYWVLGRESSPRQPRWSILRNVLHWVD
jgi:ABC-type amino acid transport substrate-binding protein